MTSPSCDLEHISLLHMTSVVNSSFISSAANLNADANVLIQAGKVLSKVADSIIKERPIITYFLQNLFLVLHVLYTINYLIGSAGLGLELNSPIGRGLVN